MTAAEEERAAPADPDGLGRKAARGGLATLLGQGGRGLVQAASLVVLARLLSPEDFGYVAMAMAVVGVGVLLRELGLSQASIQARTLSPGERDNLFWVNTALGIALGAVIVVAAPAIAALYDEPVLAQITPWLAVTFVLNGMATQHRASLDRDLRFAATATLNALGPLVGLVAAVVVALLGGGYWAVVAQQIATTTTVVAGIFVAARWRPGLPRRDVSIRAFLSFGLAAAGTRLLQYASRNVDTVVIGARFGAASVGLYNRVFQLMALPVQQLGLPAGRVALPVLARLQDHRADYVRFLVRGQSALLHVIVPALALACALAEPVVGIVLGERWLPASTTFAVLAVGGIFEAASFAPGWIYLSTARTAAELRYSLVTRPLVIGAVLLGSLWGVNGVAAGYSASLAVLWPVGLWWVSRVTGVPVGAVLGNGARAIAGHGLAAAGTGAVVAWLPVDGYWSVVGVGLLVYVALVALVCAVWRQFRRDLGQVLRTGWLLGLRRRADADGRRG